MPVDPECLFAGVRALPVESASLRSKTSWTSLPRERRTARSRKQPLPPVHRPSQGCGRNRTTPTMPFDFGDVVLVLFPFTSQTASKKRPAVVVSSRAYNRVKPDIVVMAITSQLRATAALGEIWLQDWRASGLLHDLLTVHGHASRWPILGSVSLVHCARPMLRATLVEGAPTGLDGPAECGLRDDMDIPRQVQSPAVGNAHGHDPREESRPRRQPG